MRASISSKNLVSSVLASFFILSNLPYISLSKLIVGSYACCGVSETTPIVPNKLIRLWCPTLLRIYDSTQLGLSIQFPIRHHQQSPQRILTPRMGFHTMSRAISVVFLIVVLWIVSTGAEGRGAEGAEPTCLRLVMEHQTLVKMASSLYPTGHQTVRSYADRYHESLHIAAADLRSLHAVEGCDESLDYVGTTASA